MTDRADDAPDDELGNAVAAIGTSVRRERKRRHLTVDALAKRSGVSFGRISELERGLGNPSLQTLQRIGRALDIPMPQLLAERVRDDMVIRSADRYIMPEYDSPESASRVRRELLTPRTQTSLQMIRTIVPPGFSNEHAPFRHIGTESILIQEGTLDVVHGQRHVTLRAGDAMSYGCSVTHYWSNPGSRRAVVIGSFSPFED